MDWIAWSVLLRQRLFNTLVSACNQTSDFFLARGVEMGFLDEYTVRYFGNKHWSVPAEVDVPAFRRWQREHLRGHKPRTRIIGSWNYRPAQPTWSK